MDRCGAIAQLKVAGDEIGIEMGQEDVLDSQIVFGGECEIAVHLTLRIDDGRDAVLAVADDLGGMGEAIEIKLFEDHGTLAVWVAWPVFRQRAERSRVLRKH